MTKNSGLADSPFFAPKAEPSAPPSLDRPADIEVRTSLPDQASPSMRSAQIPSELHTTSVLQMSNKPKQSRNRDVMTSRRHDITTSFNHDITISCTQDTIAKLRSAVKQIGKEPTTCRITLEEKKVLKMVEFEYSTRDIKTSANEILRIAMNIVVDDYKKNGEDSLLDKMLKALKE